MPASSHPRRRLLRGFALTLPLIFGCQAKDTAPAEGDGNSGPGAEAQAQAGAKAGTITKIRGSRGVSSPDLPEGAFLGEGATVHAGQWLELPRGTRVELELEGGQRLRLDEDSRVRLPEAGGAPLELSRGRLVVLADAPIEVHAADDRLVVERGEVELHHAGETRHFGVVQGRARLYTAQREIPLGPGASISTPAAPTTRPNTPPDETLLAAALLPTLSMAPLHESAWTEAFEQSSRIAAEIPEGVGSLTARRAGSKVERQHLRLTEQKVNVTISGRIARTEIEQAFHNDSGQTLEGIYQFPLPADASISDLQLLVGSTWMRGEMLEKGRAQRIFRQIVDATVPRDPALLQWERGGVFKLNIFPIPGKGERRIKIAYTQVLPKVGDTLRYRYPMGGSGATATEIGDFDFDLRIDDAGLDAAALAKVSTPMAELQRSESDDGLRLTLHERDYQPTHELGVDVPLGQEQRRLIAATHRDRDGQGYFMLTLEPDLELKADPRPVHYAFVLDRSHGTTPELWTAAEGLTQAMLSTLEPDDEFTVLACDTACDRLAGGLQRAQDPGAFDEVERFMNRQVLAGASDIGNMLTRAGEALGDARGDVEQVVVYLGDGVPSSGALSPDELGELAREQLGRLRVQAVALGARSDLLVLDKLVRQSGGDLIQADARDDLDKIARELRLRAQVPVARDLELELPSGLTDVYPKSIPALRPGDSLTLVGKLAEGDSAMLRGDVRLHGRGVGGEVDERFQVMLDAEYSAGGRTAVHAHLPRTWAQHEITHLTQTEGAAASERIIALSREYNVLSRFTALLVLENERMYREFKVARKSGNKDSWDGATEKEKTADASATATEIVATPTTSTKTSEDVDEDAAPPADFKELEESSREQQLAPFESEDEPSFDAFDALEPEAAPGQARAEESDGDGFDMGDDEGELFGGDSIGTNASKGSGGMPSGGGGGGGGKSSSGPFAPAPEPRPDAAKKPKSSKPKGDFEDPFGPAPNDWQQQIHHGRGGGWRPPQMILRDASGPSESERLAIADLQRVRDAAPSERKAHRNLVRRAIRDGHPQAQAFAAAWATADPDHAPALLAHADQLAAAGDPLALRAYASAVEIEPFSSKLHERMADALALAGDFERACSHRRALVSIDPRDGDAAANYVECLAAAGRRDEAQAALARARATVDKREAQALAAADKALADAGFDLSSATTRLHGSPDLRAELRWTAAENLDLAFVDRRGRRRSVLRPQGVRVRERQDGAERVETMTLREVQGTVFVEVTRPDTRAEEPLRAKLTVETPSGRRSWTLRLEPGTKRVALARWD